MDAKNMLRSDPAEFTVAATKILRGKQRMPVHPQELERNVSRCTGCGDNNWQQSRDTEPSNWISEGRTVVCFSKESMKYVTLELGRGCADSVYSSLESESRTPISG